MEKTKEQLQEDLKVFEFQLRNRQNRLQQLRSMDAPQSIVVAEVRLVNKARNAIKETKEELKKFE